MKKILPVIQFSHKIIVSKLKLGGSAIDATAGNGNDSLFLLQNLNRKSKLYIFDIQEEAIINTKARLERENTSKNYKLVDNKISYFHTGHENMKKYINEDVRVVMFNLGYLPNSASNIITKAATSLSALKQALDLLMEQGIISIVLYPGHDGGQEEVDCILDFTKKLNSSEYNVIKYKNINKEKAPFLILIEKR